MLGLILLPLRFFAVVLGDAVYTVAVGTADFFLKKNIRDESHSDTIRMFN
jgi:hypothetical protein